jgi:regulatory protein
MEGIVTAVEPQRRRGGRRVNVFVDGRFSFSLERDLADLVRVGRPISELKSAELLLQDEQARAFEAALAFLAHRPRSERELRDRLRRKEVPPPTLEAVVERLKQLRLIDDQDFARYWVEQRQTHRPRGGRLLRQELRRKGVDADTAAEIVETAEEDEDSVEAACRAARRKAEGLRAQDERTFDQKIGQFLVRRGFDYETARSACRRLREEVSEVG